MHNLIILLLLCTLHAATAQKQDYYWPFGKDQNINQQGVQASEFDFNKTPFKVEVRQGGLQFDQNNSSICDKDGNLLFYTNGCAVTNRFHEVMPNGASINAGLFFDDFWFGDCDFGYPGRQDITILSDPGNELGYYIIHKPRHMDSITELRWMKDLMYTYVDLSLDGGLGDVVEKNVSFYEGEMLWSYLTAINHENGKDWWIINPVLPQGFLVYILTVDGLAFSSFQDGPQWDKRYSGSAGEAKFSPDGNKYACFNEVEGLLLYDFDREQGLLSNEQNIPWNMGSPPRFASCEWSPSSRFLYMSHSDTLWQLDTSKDPLEEGLEFIAKYNGVNDPLPTTFFASALGPDCRIYIRPGSGSNSFHVIHKPDEKGTACDFVQQGVKLPFIAARGSFPNFPRFRVDEEEKCDPSIVSIVGETVWWRRDLTVYPSPTTGPITIELLEDHYDGMVYVLDMQGQMVLHKEVQILTGELRIDLSYLPSGIYSVEFVPEDSKDRVVWTKKVVVE